MPWIFAYLILFIIIIFAFKAAFKEGTTWRSRFKSWFFLFLPVALFMWDYPVTYYQHVHDCNTEGGLKVYIQPEKTDDAVQLGTKHFADIGAAESVLKDFHPQLKLVEVGDDYYNYEKRKREYQYYAISVVKAANNGSKRDRDWGFNQNEIPQFSEGMYLVSKHYEHDKALHRSKTQWRLTKNGELYATITTFVHAWPKIQYPDATPAWSCEIVHQQFRRPYKDLVRLILN